MLAALGAFALATGLSLYITPVMRRAALKFGIVDRPDGRLKTHGEPVPYFGGLAVFTAFLFTLAVTFQFSQSVLGILLAATIVLLAGLIDDLGALTPWEKLGCECVAIAVLLKSGLFVKLLFLPTIVGALLSVFWLLTMTNALNIIDIMDGLAAGVAAIAALFLAAIAIVNGEPMVAVMAAALAGSLAGFLRFNFRPARIYLGDAGSLFVGLTLASLAMNLHYTSRNWLAMVTPAIVLGVPLFDLAFVAFVRWEKGLSPLRGSPDHAALRLQRAGFDVERVVVLAYFCGIVLGACGLLVMRARTGPEAAGVLAALAVAGLVAAWVLRGIER